MTEQLSQQRTTQRGDGASHTIMCTEMRSAEHTGMHASTSAATHTSPHVQLRTASHGYANPASNPAANPAANPRLRRARTTIWLILFLVGGIGLAYNALVRPHGMAEVYVERSEKTFVEADIAAPVGAPSGEKASTKWLASDSPALQDGSAIAMAGAAHTLTINETVGVPPRAARERIAAADRAVLSVIWLYEGGQHGRLGKWPEMVLFVAGLLDRADADGFNLLSLSPSAALQASLLAGSTGTRSTA